MSHQADTVLLFDTSTVLTASERGQLEKLAKEVAGSILERETDRTKRALLLYRGAHVFRTMLMQAAFDISEAICGSQGCLRPPDHTGMHLDKDGGKWKGVRR